ncbi:hypothetical protein FJV41_41260 [Myxococcus llanfairpwllgwyngyllgogerychwyrndrobwllllantysiliogogogochensis]|uniref:Lipoprotein n=1 Tax=Myxococcus llanfairpwllgwyngyllgogerychwyrndrobwllllantysiliogogogochensis TaxID=2590453 RepID=A0A540WM36_9BACT|nr:hypothetical protein [Myxococcus llanfairpwllgwyngyllgogerychwyrndrobwllllantysiliogogogochensis]TQF10079.1 hypothetical protein FJV41_41260 [Myxococcus llanfairpwllgwyngyllgogerychwyrndrobwllllantysiliogogogochensis]
MRPGLLLSCLVLSLTSACRKPSPLRVPVPEVKPRVRVSFQPPVDRVLTESQRGARVVEQGGSVLREEAELTTESRFTPNEGGWLLTQSVTHAKQSRAGVEVEGWVDDVLLRFALRLQLAADGTFVKLVSPEAAAEAVRQSVPSGVDAKPLARFFAPEALEGRTRREWEAKFGGLFQRHLSEGQRTWAVDTLPAGDKQVAYVLERTVQGTRDTEYGDAVVLSLRCLDAVPQDAPDELTDAWEEAGRPELTPGVTCQGEQVMAYGRFVPVSRELTVKAPVDGAAWTVTMESRAQGLQEEAR